MKYHRFLGAKEIGKVHKMDDDSKTSVLERYEISIEKTDRFSKNEITPIVMGLYGEVGSIMATSKKYYREKKAYAGHRNAVEEEFGDAFWYFSALCRRLDIDIQSVFANKISGSKIREKASEPMQYFSIPRTSACQPGQSTK